MLDHTILYSGPPAGTQREPQRGDLVGAGSQLGCTDGTGSGPARLLSGMPCRLTCTWRERGTFLQVVRTLMGPVREEIGATFL